MKTVTAFAFFAFLWLTNCTQVATQYRVDSNGRLAKVGTFQPEWGPVDKHLAYNIDGMLFTYDLSAIHGEVRGHRQPPGHLARGEHLIPFLAEMDAPLSGAGKTFFGGFVGWPDESTKLTTQEARFINGRKWFVTSDFEKAASGIIKRRVFWTKRGEFLITFSVNFSSAPLDAHWRQKRLDILERIVSGFQMQRTV